MRSRAGSRLGFERGERLLRGLAAVGLLAGLGTQAAAGELVGRVSDASGVHALAGAEVQILGSNRRAASATSGRFRFADLPAGEYRVVVRYPGTQTYTATIRVGETGTETLNVRLHASEGLTEEMIVVGQRASQAGALSQQRNADSISSFLTRDAIGQFPDQNVTEAVRRLPGVSVQNDQGEGRFIVLRGLDPNLNAASLNGARVTSPESDVRAVALDVVPSELVESIEVHKSLIPEMDGDAIGGSIDIRTTSALDRSEPLLSITGSGSYNDLMEEWSPKVGIDASTMLTDRLGVSVGLSYFERELGSDNLEAEDWSEANGAVYAESMELRDYEIERTRTGATVGLDFLATEDTRLFARGVYSAFEDQEFRSRMALDFGDAEPVTGDASRAVFDLGPGEELSVERDIKDRNEKQEITSLVVGGETFHDAWTFDYLASYTYSEEHESDTFDPTLFERTFEAGELVLTQLRTGSDGPRVVVAPESLASFTDAEGYVFAETQRIDGLAEDEEYGLRFDAAREVSVGDMRAELKAGVKGRWREKRYDLDLDIFDGYAGADEFLLSDVVGAVDYPFGLLNPVPSASRVRDALGNLVDFERNALDSEFDAAASQFHVDEDVLASYLQATIEQGPWRWVVGVRVERTDNDISGNRVDLVEEGGSWNGAVVDADSLFVTPLSFSKSDTQWLPSANLRYEATDDLVLRAAAYRSLFRPNIEDLAPRFVVEQSDADEREGEFGNPDLDPYTAWNFDAGVEWYFADNAVLQGGVFYKSIEDFIVRSVVEDVTFNGVFADEAVIPRNGDDADVLGVELNYQHALTGLPAPWNGLLISSNYTYVDSEGEFDGRGIDLPGTSKHVANVALGYEKGPMSLRLAYVYRDAYLDEVSADGEADIAVAEHGSLDLTAKYRISPQVQMFVEAINITDEPYVAHVRTPRFGDRIAQYEEYSFTLNVGFRATL